MNFLRKIFDWLFGKKKEKIVTSPPPKEDLALIRISMRQYPKSKNMIVYYLKLEEETKRVYITPTTTSKVLLEVVKKANELTQDIDTKKLDQVSIEIVTTRLYEILYHRFQTGIFRDKGAKVESALPYEGEQQS